MTSTGAAKRSWLLMETRARHLPETFDDVEQWGDVSCDAWADDSRQAHFAGSCRAQEPHGVLQAKEFAGVCSNCLKKNCVNSLLLQYIHLFLTKIQACNAGQRHRPSLPGET